MSYHIATDVLSFETKAGALGRLLDAYQASPYHLQDPHIARISMAPTEAAQAWSRALTGSRGRDDDKKLLVILTDLEEIQRRAVLLKLRRRAPTIVVRWWDAPANLRESYRNRLVFNRYTGINFISTRAVLEANSLRRPGGLTLDNPVLLEQEQLLGADSPLRMFRHVLQSLTSPSRSDIFGRIKRNHGHIRLSVATHFYCNQQNIHTVTSLLEGYARYASELLDRIQFVVVDDGSPVDYTIPDVGLNLTWIKITEDIRWNQAGARNLALLYARSNNVIISDVDHAFPEHTLQWLAGRNVPHRRFYKFYRKMPDGSIIKGSPNIFYLSRARWFQLFGTDEEFAGAYGAEDFRLVKNFKNHGTVQSHLPKRYYCEEREVDRKKSYHSLVRDLSFNTPVDTRKRLEADYFGADFGHSRSCLNFQWKVLLDRERDVPTPRIDRTWRPTWWFRTIHSFLCSC
ncbi:MAG TPA: glycosyltransferase family A protein [Nitrospiraceae bacterium]|nr:glycosyltransferase family A protein [Nitrospiraceae bacterium]